MIIPTLDEAAWVGRAVQHIKQIDDTVEVIVVDGGSGDDFGANDEEILLYVTRFLPNDLADAIRSAPAEWDVDHTKYH